MNRMRTDYDIVQIAVHICTAHAERMNLYFVFEYNAIALL